ncbi:MULTISPECIES: outer membrane beta-barrel family protein [unclassified Flavobacterium]|uniref:outer membrane beta-barrel family protein n=1 Tax=unclassified Flavobacterium TaxID=196869 RepID=UPI001F1450C7|nr:MULTISPECIES: outer membrane beta-barrel family protein [unclassified Flavobacterium]UMY65585.1 TonB-dependent receptor [Flavobacterium sp. HJ-32-4]
MHSFLLLAFFFTFAGSWAQETTPSRASETTLQGKVVDDTGANPIASAIVKIATVKDSVSVGSGMTKEDGTFRLKANLTEPCFLTVSLIGLERRVIPLVANAKGGSVDLGVIKMKEASIDLDEVRIEGNYRMRIDVDKRVYRIDTDAVGANGTAGDILQNIPSVFVNANGSVTLRGGKVKMYINGKPCGILGISRSQVLDYIPASMIESIEVMNDPSAKYDSDGSSGIINIILKSQNRPGVNAMIMVSGGSYDRYNASSNVSFNYKKLSLFASYDVKQSHMRSWESKDRETNQGGSTRYVNQDRDFLSQTVTQNSRFRGEYAFNKKNTLGFSFLHSQVADKDDNDFLYRQYDGAFTLTDLYNRNIKETDSDASNNVTLNYTKKFQRPQQQLSADLFYARGTERTDGDIVQTYYNTDGTPAPTLPDIARTKEENREQNFVAQVDYDQPLPGKAKMEMGMKFRIKRNEAGYRLDNYYQPLDIYITDPQISNDFRYDIGINAGYVTYRNKFRNFSYKVGLRVENTNVSFDVSNGLRNSFDYTDAFPSLHLLQEFKNNHKVTARFSRRIDRPVFREINPLQQFNDPFFLNKGNPNLLPEYTNSFDVTYTKSWKESSVSFSLYYRYAVGSIERIVLLRSDGVTETNFQNINSTKNAGVEVNAYFQLYKWWKINSSLNYYNERIDASNVGTPYSTDNFSLNGKMNHNFTPWKKSMLQISGNYQSPTFSPLVKNFGQYYVDASFKQDLYNKKLSVSLRCTDIFHTQRRYYDMTAPNFIVTSRFARQSRAVYLGITLRPFRNKKQEEEKTEEPDENTEERDD